MIPERPTEAELDAPRKKGYAFVYHDLEGQEIARGGPFPTLREAQKAAFRAYGDAREVQIRDYGTTGLRDEIKLFEQVYRPKRPNRNRTWSYTLRDVQGNVIKRGGPYKRQYDAELAAMAAKAEAARAARERGTQLDEISPVVDEKLKRQRKQAKKRAKKKAAKTRRRTFQPKRTKKRKPRRNSWKKVEGEVAPKSVFEAEAAKVADTVDSVQRGYEASREAIQDKLNAEFLRVTAVGMGLPLERAREALKYWVPWEEWLEQWKATIRGHDPDAHFDFKTVAECVGRYVHPDTLVVLSQQDILTATPEQIESDNAMVVVQIGRITYDGANPLYELWTAGYYSLKNTDFAAQAAGFLRDSGFATVGTSRGSAGSGVAWSERTERRRRRRRVERRQTYAVIGIVPFMAAPREFTKKTKKRKRRK